MKIKKVDASLREANTWVFDLDDTLYPHDSGLWKQIDQRISTYIKKQLSLNDDREVAHLRNYFRRNYGGALKGLLEEYNVDAFDYLADVHDIDYSKLEPNPELANDISRLPGRKLVFTNGDIAHAKRVIEKMGLNRCFDGIFDVTSTDFIPKPYIQAYNMFLSHFDIDPHKTVMFEDNLANLEICKKLGMTTIYIGNKILETRPAYIDFTANRLDVFVHDLVGSLDG